MWRCRGDGLRGGDMDLERAWPEAGRSDGDVEFANFEWRWFANITQTQVENMRRVEISVVLAENPDRLLINLVGFLSKPSNGQVAITPWEGNPAGTGLPGEGGRTPGVRGNSP